MSNVVLIGYMGSGKSTVGMELANHLSYEFLDTDEFFEEATGTKISDFFARFGEKEFRNKETLILEGLNGVNGKVISTGGGVVERSENLEHLRELGRIIYLDASPDILWGRVGKDKSRPLALDLTKFNANFRRRLPIYKEWADVVIETRGKSPEELAKLIVKEIINESTNN